MGGELGQLEEGRAGVEQVADPLARQQLAAFLVAFARRLAAALFDALGRPVEIEYTDTPAAIRDKYQYFTEAPMARLRAAGFDAPFTAVEEGVGRYVAEFLATDDPYL